MAVYQRQGRAGRIISVAVALAAGIILTFTAGAVPASAASIGLTGPARGIAVDPATDTGYVAELPASGTIANVAVIDLASGTLAATVPVGVAPDSIAVDPVTDVVYVVNAVSSTVSVIDGSSDTVTATIPVSSARDAAGGIAVDPATDTVYVGVRQSSSSGPIDSVAVISGSSDTVTGTIAAVPPGCGFPLAIAVNPVTDTVYAAFGGGCYNLDVINGATNTVTATILQVQAEAIAVNPDTGTFFVASYGETVSAYSGATDTVIGTVDLGEPTNSLAVNPGTGAVFANSDSDPSAIYVINSTSTAITATIPLSGSCGDLTADPETGALVYSCTQYPDSFVSLIQLP